MNKIMLNDRILKLFDFELGAEEKKKSKTIITVSTFLFTGRNIVGYISWNNKKNNCNFVQ